MLTLLLVVFVLGYLMIAFEKPVKIDKAASALLTGVLCWTIYMLGSDELVSVESIPAWFSEFLRHENSGAEGHHLIIDYISRGQLALALGEISGILFFLMGAMIIVELVDAYEGFSVITDRINATKKVTLLWIIGFITFFLSSVLDNLTTTIVMISLLKKLVKDHQTRLFFAGIVVIAANAGGAWTVIGDVTTTMLWIKGKISAVEIMKALILPSLACLTIPLLVMSVRMKGKVERPDDHHHGKDSRINRSHQWIMLFSGVGGLLFVPVFKTVTHLPPFMGMMFSLSVLWMISEILNRKMDEHTRSSTHVLTILKKIDTSSVLFFLGILLAIGTLGATGFLGDLATSLADGLSGIFPDEQAALSAIAIIIGLVSAVVDNVPLVAAGIEMYKDLPMDAPFWEFLAYCAGTGGSCLVIGSAAGVAAMGMEKIDFLWYLKKISLWALFGYFGGAAVYLVQIYVFKI